MPANNSSKPLLTRRFTKAGVHPYDLVGWEKRDAVIPSKSDPTKPAFELKGVEFPTTWSQNATNIVAQKYFAKAGVPQGREMSVRELFDRVVDKIAAEGAANGYFANKEEREIFEAELKHMLVHQMVSFNSPVWFNIGRADRPQQASACFILSVEDDMEDILDWIKEEGLIFKGGSGSGVDISKLRSKYEGLSGGGTSSGAVTFMRGADASAGTIKSGGTTRRAAKMVTMNDDHPDVDEFIWCKAEEEKKARALAAAGFDMSLDSPHWASIQYQNANNSVRLSDEFMKTVIDDEEWCLVARTTGECIRRVSGREMMRQIAAAAHESADPGVQYRTTINDWHTTPSGGMITSSNPCSEYMSNDDTSCNLASLNLMKFLNNDDQFQTEDFAHATRVIFTAQEILISFADYPTALIGENTRKWRQLGTGFANAGALLMALGLPYDSDAGRAAIGAITSLMTGECYAQSGRMAERVGPYATWDLDKDPHVRVLKKHRTAAKELETSIGDGPFNEVVHASVRSWNSAVKAGQTGAGMRNAQATVLAPTGTISFMMDCDTTGIEPDFALVKGKKLVGGGDMVIVNQTVPRALKNLGYSEDQRQEILAYIQEPVSHEGGWSGPRGHVIGAPHLDGDHYPVFDTAVGERAISHHGHLKMMAAAQPFLSGAISKTVNLPENTTVEDVMDTFIEGWRLGLKAVAVYRDGTKHAQPLGTDKTKDADGIETDVDVLARGQRRRVPDEAQTRRRKFRVGSATGYIHVGLFEDGTPGDVFIHVSRAGSQLRGWAEVFSLAISMALQHGMPLEELVEKFAYQSFEPSGMTGDRAIPTSRSIVDYVVRWMAKEFLDPSLHADYGITTPQSQIPTESEDYSAVIATSPHPEPIVVRPVPQTPRVAPKAAEGTGSCDRCGGAMIWSGKCQTCTQCGNTGGCG